MTPKILVAAAAATVLPAIAAAQDAFSLAYGIAVTSNYIDNGATQSDDNPALQGYVEGSYGRFFAGVWSSTVDFPDDPEFGGDQFEFDLYAGIRNTFEQFGNLEFELNYTRYVYDDSGDCCGDIILILGYPVEDLGAVGFELDWDPENETTWTEIVGAVTFAEVWEAGGVLGTDWGTEEWGEDDKVAWNLGVTRGLGDFASVDLRYHDSNYDPARGVLTISLDF